MAERKHSHTGYICRHSGTKLCTTDKEPISLEKSMLERAEAGQRNTKVMPRQ